MIDWAFTIATAIYTVIGVTGYLMFGNAVSDEVSLEAFRGTSNLTLLLVQ